MSLAYRDEGARERHEYQLTEAGFELRTALVALIAWGDKHLVDPEGPPLQAVHRGFGEPGRARRALRRRSPGEWSDITFAPGPGALPTDST